MNRVSATRLLFLIGAAIVFSSPSLSADEHVIAYRINYMVPDAGSLAERLKQVDVVAVVKIAGSGRARVAGVSLTALAKNEDVVPDIDLPPVILTEHSAEVLEILKTSTSRIAPGAAMSLLQHGGEATWRERLVRTHANVPDLAPGATYLVFLNYNEASAGMMVSPFDVFRVDRGHIEATAVSSTKYATSIVGLTPHDGLALVRRALIDRASD
jgi:hypothetical protein